MGFSSWAGLAIGVYVVLGFGAELVFLGLETELEVVRGVPWVVEAGFVDLVFVSVELGDLGVVVPEVFDVRVLVDAVRFVLPVFVLVDADDFFVPLDSDRAFLSALILCAFTPARVASTGAANILITDATSIAQKKEALDGLYPSRRGILIEVR